MAVFDAKALRNLGGKWRKEKVKVGRFEKKVWPRPNVMYFAFARREEVEEAPNATRRSENGKPESERRRPVRSERGYIHRTRVYALKGPYGYRP